MMINCVIYIIRWTVKSAIVKVMDHAEKMIYLINIRVRRFLFIIMVLIVVKI